MIHGEKAHSCYFSKDAYRDMMRNGESVAAKAGNKELLLIPDAVHTDLYDNLAVIPFDKICEFYKTYLR